MTRAELTELAEAHEVDLIFYEPAHIFDPAIVGLVTGHGQAPAVLYDRAIVLDGLQRDFGGDREAAIEWFEVNTISGWVGDATPRFVTSEPDEGG